MSQLNALLKNEAMMKRQRVALTRSQKKEICLLLSQKPPLTQTAVARSYGIKQNIVSLVNSSLVKEEDDIEEVFIHPTVSVKSALESLQVLSDFLSNAPAVIETYFLRFGV